MHADRWFLVLTLLTAGLACRGSGDPAFVQLREARRLASEIRIHFTRASEASDRAVMADTDDESIKFARDAEAATLAVGTTMAALAQRIAGLGDQTNVDLLGRFQERFVRYRELDKELLKLAVENTNLKAQRLLFGPVGQAANEFCSALDLFVTQAPSSAARRSVDAILRAQLALREIEVLQAPHIAEAKGPEMDRLEREMTSRQATTRATLVAIEQGASPQARAALDRAKAALDSFESLSRQLIELSRKNSNLHSLQLALKQKPALTSACDESLVALQNALANQDFTGTR